MELKENPYKSQFARTVNFPPVQQENPKKIKVDNEGFFYWEK